MTQVKQGDSVKINYTGKLEDGTVFDTSEGREPLTFTVGDGKVILGFEEAVVGMSPGDSKNVTIPVDKAYGQRNEDLVLAVPKSQIPPDLTPEVGQMLEMGSPSGELVMVRVAEVTDKQVKLDANPPLAGKDLVFDIELVEIS